MFKRILTNPRTYYVSISIIVLLEIPWYLLMNRSTNLEVVERRALPDQLVYECCVPLNVTLKKNLFFLKTHKTGSTTVQNIILRFAEKYSRTVMWPIYFKYYEPLSKKSLIPGTITPDNKYNILAYHMRYTSELKSYRYPGTPMITILRHPAKLFQSAYVYFQMSRTTNMTFEQFVKAPIKPSYLGGIHIDKVYKGYNSMSVDLGFNLKHVNNTNIIRKFIDKIDREFDFVMITEYMDESLVLLANLMGWPLEYVVYLKLNARPDTSNYKQTEQDVQELLELNEVDHLLYDHFLAKFRNCVRQYGESRMNERVRQLREMNEEFYDRCVAAENRRGLGKTVNYKLKNSSDSECILAIRDQQPGPL